MKTISTPLRLSALSLIAACLGSSVSCMTTYDGYGRPVQSVDPGAAVAGVAAAGLIGYAIANNSNNESRHHDYHDNHGEGYYRGGYDDGGYNRGGYRPCY